VADPVPSSQGRELQGRAAIATGDETGQPGTDPQIRGDHARKAQRRNRQHLLVVGQGRARGQTNYSAAKAGMVGMTTAAAKEVAHLGAIVNVFQPGLTRWAMREAIPQRIWDAKMAEIPMGRAGRAQ
jgi:NAD(P)-dependent dehydrogenase (short-subunit alcohol dehydrogenase family)